MNILGIGKKVEVKKKITFADITSGFSAMLDSLLELENQSNADLKVIAVEQKSLDNRKDFTQAELDNATETAANIKKVIPALDKKKVVSKG